MRFSPAAAEIYRFRIEEIREVLQEFGKNTSIIPLTPTTFTTSIVFSCKMGDSGDPGMTTVRIDSFSMVNQIGGTAEIQTDTGCKVFQGVEWNVRFDHSGHIATIENYHALRKQLVAENRQDIYTEEYFIKLIEKATAILPKDNGSLGEWKKNNPFQNSLPFPVESSFVLSEFNDAAARINISGEVGGMLKVSNTEMVLKGQESGKVELYSSGFVKSADDLLSMTGYTDIDGMKMSMTVRNQVTVRGEKMR